MIIKRVTVGPFEENCYLVADGPGGAAVIVDPGDEGDRIVTMAADDGCVPTAVWLTHAHLDHIGAVSAVRRAWPGIPVSLHPADQVIYANGALAAARYGLPWEQPDTPDASFADGDMLTLGSLRFDVWHLPGHAPGHVAFIGEGLMIGGDCVFKGSVGRTDLPLSDPGAFARSLQKILTLPDDTVIYPGHGPPTTIGRERASNPFLA